MSTISQLQSAISSLNSEISQLRYENAEMEREIQMMTQSISNASSTVVSAERTSVGALKSGVYTINHDDDVLKNVSVIGKDIQHKIDLYKNIENAYKNIRNLKNKLNSNQGNEKKVRNVVTAMVENEEKMFASDETLRTQAEKLHIETKNFFLSYVMMEIQLRKDGEHSAADRALAMAEELDARKTAWVYYIIAMCRRDDKSAAKWLDKIMLKPLVGAEKEFMKILTLISLRDDSENSRKIKHYIGLDVLDTIDNAEIINRILASFNLVSTVQPPVYKHLDESVAQSKDLHLALKGAMNNDNVVAFVQKLSAKNHEKMRNDILYRMFDSIISTCHSATAQEYLDEIARNEKVIEAHGVMEDAMANTAKAAVYDVSDIKLEDCMFEWLNDNTPYDGKRELSEVSYEKYRPSYKSAYRRYVKNYRVKYTEKVNLTIGEYTTKTSLTSIDDEQDNINKFCQQRCDAKKSLIKDTKFILLMIFGGVLTVAGIVLNFIDALGGFRIAGMVICVIAGLVLLILGARTKYGNYRKLVAADEECERDKIAYGEQMRRVYDDMQAYRALYAQFDSREAPDSAF